MKTQTIGLIVVIAVVIAGIAAYVALQPSAPLTPTPTATTTSTSTTTTSTTTSTKKLKVGVIFPGPITDASFNMLGYQAWTKIATPLNLEFVYSEGMGALPDAGRAAREYAAAGYDLVYFHGGQFPGTALEVAPAYPKTIFATIGEIKPENMPSNLGAYYYFLQEPYYLMGYIAGKMTKTGKIGVVGGVKIPYMVEWINDVKAGAVKANPNVSVIISFSGNFNDPVTAKETTLTQIATGADIIIFEQNEGAKGVFEAVKEKTVYTMGYFYDQNSFAPNLVLTSSVVDLEKMFTNIVGKIRNNTFAKTFTFYTMKDGSISLAPYYGLVPTSVANEVEQVKQDILSGKITVPRIPTV